MGVVEVPEIRYAVSDELSLAYFDIAGGPHTLVVIPGIVSHLEEMSDLLPGWGRFIGWLNQFARVIAFDKRGCGMSDRMTGAPSLEERMADIDIVMDAAGIDDATLVAMSEAGSIAMLYAAAHPGRVSSLVLCDSYAKFTATDVYPWGQSVEQMDYLVGEFCDEWGSGVSAERLTRD